MSKKDETDRKIKVFLYSYCPLDMGCEGVLIGLASLDGGKAIEIKYDSERPSRCGGDKVYIRKIKRNEDDKTGEGLHFLEGFGIPLVYLDGERPGGYKKEAISINKDFFQFLCTELKR